MTTHLKGLRAENFKRLTLVDIDFNEAGGVVAIMGPNEAGKSSLIDALESTIAGRKAQTFVAPVHAGADSARIVATFDDLIVTRIFKANGTTSIEVKGADGRRYNSSEEVLRRLYSHVALDPLAFSRLSDKEQVAQLLPLIGFDPAPLDARHDTAYAARTEQNRDVKALEARITALPDPQPGLPTEYVDAAALSDELAVALGTNSTGEMLRTAADAATQAATAAANRVARLRAELAEAENDHAAKVLEVEAKTQELDAFVPVEVEPIRARIADATRINNAIQDKRERDKLTAELAAARGGVDKLNAELEAVKNEKAAALAAATMPVPKLSIDLEQNILLLDGLPFSQVSTGVKIRTGTAIAMALNPALKLIVIRDASLLDEGNRKVIDELAKANEFLVLMEIADDNEPVGVVIEEGFVKEVRA